ncbi:MAG: hypothetical protein ABI186_01910, partial [Candidatus Elarobacter sp.]
APLTTPGVDPATCAGLGTSPTGDPRYPYGAPGGPAYDSTTCGTLNAVPDPFTHQFDSIGAFRAPSQLLLHAQVSYDINKHVSLVANFANIINRCFGGTKVGFSVSGACNYSIISPSGLAPVGNVYNPGFAIQPYLATPYQAQFAGNPFNMYVEARIKL